jgi:hypothetical protein
MLDSAPPSPVITGLLWAGLDCSPQVPPDTQGEQRRMRQTSKLLAQDSITVVDRV